MQATDCDTAVHSVSTHHVNPWTVHSDLSQLNSEVKCLISVSPTARSNVSSQSAQQRGQMSHLSQPNSEVKCLISVSSTARSNVSSQSAQQRGQMSHLSQPNREVKCHISVSPTGKSNVSDPSKLNRKVSCLSALTTMLSFHLNDLTITLPFSLSAKYYVTNTSALQLEFPSYFIALQSKYDSLDLDLDQSITNHPFTAIGAAVWGAQFAGTIGSWLLPEPI